MTPVDQTRFGAVDGDCFAACVATLLGLPLAEIPNFCAPEQLDADGRWWPNFRAWCAARGLEAVCLLAADQPPGAVPDFDAIGSGPSPRGAFLHATVWRNGRLWHDPHPSRAGLAGPPVDWIWFQQLEVTDVVPE